MKKAFWLVGTVWWFGTALAQPVDLSVVHRHLFRDCRGTLHIGKDGIEYDTSHRKDARQWSYLDIRQLKLEANRLEILTYEDQRRMLGRDRIFRFRIVDGEINPALAAFLHEKVLVPVSAVIPSVADDAPPAFQIPVKHRHTWGGCQGTLRLAAKGVTFESEDRLNHSRFWRYSDLQHWGQTSDYRLQILTREQKWGGPQRVFQFELKTALPAGAYDYVWVRVHPSAFDSRTVQ